MGLTGSSEPAAVLGRRRDLADQLGFDLERALMTVQEHGANVVAFHRARPERRGGAQEGVWHTPR